MDSLDIRPDRARTHPLEMSLSTHSGIQQLLMMEMDKPPPLQLFLQQLQQKALLQTQLWLILERCLRRAIHFRDGIRKPMD